MATKVASTSSRKENPDGPITAVFTNGTFEQPSAKRMRKWLRKHGLTVRHATKQGAKWLFDHEGPESVTLKALPKPRSRKSRKASEKKTTPVAAKKEAGTDTAAS